MDFNDRISTDAAARRAQDGLAQVREAANNVDWNMALAHRNREDQMSNGLKVLGQMREIQNRNEMDRINRGIQAQDAIMSSIAVTPRGGSLPAEQVAYLNQLRGIQSNADGSPVNGQIVGAGYNQKTGGYRFVTANVGNDGSVSQTEHEMSPAQVYGMMHNYPGIFDENALAEQKAHAFKFDKSLTEDRLGMFAKTATDGYKRMQDRIYLAGKAERERRKGELKYRQIKFIQAEVAKMRGAKRKNIAGAEEPAYTDEQIDDRETELYGIFGLEKPQGKKGQEPNPQGESPRGGQAASSRVDNSGNEKWGSLTPAQIEKVKAKGGTYDEKTGEIVLPNGKRMKV